MVSSAEGVKRCPRCELTQPLSAFYRNAARRDGRGTYCKPCELAVSRPHQVSETGREGARRRAKRRREELIAELGGECACCGENTYEFLQFDHVKGGGASHRRALGRSSLSTSDIRRAGMENFQVLCCNCNFAKGIHGECPHQTKER